MIKGRFMRPLEQHCGTGQKLTVRLWRSAAGVAALEFALIAPIIIALLAGLANYGLAMFDKMELVSAARAGAQLALIDSDVTTSEIQAAVVASTNLSISTSDVSVAQSCECADGTSVTCGATCGDGSSNRYFYTVTASEDFTLLILGTTITLSGSAVVRTQ